ncbi:MAG: hypothetical protein ABI992_09705 [Chthoniobacterales bacterium]
MIDDLSAGKEPLETWLVDSSGNIAMSGAGLALLEAEITPFYNPTPAEFGSPNESRTSH